MPFNIGLSGLNAASQDLRVIGNNISNASTTGFKVSRVEFADVFSQSYGGISRTSIGSGVRVGAVTQEFTQGTIEFTGNSLDLAVNGEGFFVLDDNGSKVYSRAGAFQLDRDGHIVNSGGLRLQTYPPRTTGETDSEFNIGQLSDLKLPLDDSAPLATSQVKAQINLRADADPPVDDTGVPVTDIDLNDPDTYNFSSSVTVYDSLGTPRTMTLYFLKPGTGGPPPTPVVADPLKWKVYAELDGLTPAATPHTPANSFELEFDSNGKLLNPTGALDVPFDLANYDPINGATIGPIDPTTGEGTGVVSLDLTGMTQFGTEYTVNDFSQDGYTTGRLSGLDIDQSGALFARYTNGQSALLGQVALANFTNPQGLQELGDNNWGETHGSGEPAYGAAGTSNFGLIHSGGLEASNVDIAEELVNLITAQRNFQANAQTISTADQVTQTIINIR